MGYVYLLTDNNGHYKIGVTKDNVDKRISSLQTGNPGKLELIHKYKSEFYRKIERILHRKFIMQRTQGEWFTLEKNDIHEFIHECQFVENNLKLLRANNNPFI